MVDGVAEAVGVADFELDQPVEPSLAALVTPVWMNASIWGQALMHRAVRPPEHQHVPLVALRLLEVMVPNRSRSNGCTGDVAHDRPTPLSPDIARQRQALLDEEAAEVADAVRRGRLDEIARELADIVYVAYGTALAYGLDVDAVLAEVHRANKSKLGEDGR